MLPKKTFYITTALPYVNAEPHVGHAMEIIRADIVARYKVLTDHEVFFNTGTDEHGIKIYRKAEEQKIPTQDYVDYYAGFFKKLIKDLGLWEGINFIRTTDPHHKAAAQEFWKRCKAAGDIYKKTYQIKYCVGCELEKTDSELVESKCPLHPNLSIEFINEENYFFKFSKYQKNLIELYEKNSGFVVPSFRLNEIKAFIERGLDDFSISRLRSKMPWGVPVPDDEDQVMYVWFDALVNYISAIGWPNDMAKFEKWWPVTQYAGKDNLRQQSAMWQAMLMSAGIAPSQQIIINGFITGPGGIKMSKSIGNVISPSDLVGEYGKDALRYFVSRELSAFEDSPFTLELFKERYNTALANGYGNLSSRILKMAVTNNITTSKEVVLLPEAEIFETEEYKEAFDSFELNKAADFVWNKISGLDKFIQENEPFKKVKIDKTAGEKDMQYLLDELVIISYLLLPFIPESATKVLQAIIDKKTLETPLFPRKD